MTSNTFERFFLYYEDCHRELFDGMIPFHLFAMIEKVFPFIKNIVWKKKNLDLQSKFSVKDLLGCSRVAIFERENNNTGFDALYFEETVQKEKVCFAYQFTASKTDKLYPYTDMKKQILSTYNAVSPQHTGKIVFVFIVARPMAENFPDNARFNINGRKISASVNGDHAFVVINRVDLNKIICPTFVPYISTIAWKNVVDEMEVDK